MIFNILTLFPKMFGDSSDFFPENKNSQEKRYFIKGPFSESILKRAQEKGLIKINIFNLRNWGIGRHRQVDDSPYGGGAGMVLRVDVVDSALHYLKSKVKSQKSKVILLTPQGKKFNQKIAQSLAKYSELILICGHYEGFDERIRRLVDEEISIGDYVLTGGEIPAMVLVDCIARLIPGVLGKEESVKEESFTAQNSKLPGRAGKTQNLLEYPQYTRPDDYKGQKVPDILLSGNHAKIEKWRKETSLKKTKKKRPDLLK